MQVEWSHPLSGSSSALLPIAAPKPAHKKMSGLSQKQTLRRRRIEFIR